MMDGDDLGLEEGDMLGAEVTKNFWRLDIAAQGIGGVMGRFKSCGGQLVLVTLVPQSLKLLLQLLSDGDGVEYAMSSTAVCTVWRLRATKHGKLEME